MAGAYCNFCGHRCFVYREISVGGTKLWWGHMATCPKGMEFDRKVLGVTHREAHNPRPRKDNAQ
jgi:hypothetical protein